MLDAGGAAAALVERVRARPWGLAVVAIADGETSFSLDEGVDPLTTGTRFQIGSITKTMTGVLLGEAVTRGEVRLDTKVGELLDRFGRCSHITLLDLATQRSGLPRLPPNLDLETIDKLDPYAAYTTEDLIAALELVEPGPTGSYEYSNFGFMLLGLLLGIAGGTEYPQLIDERLFRPLGMRAAVCDVATEDAAPGYSGSQQVPWWRTHLPGPGGVGASIEDLATYLQTHLAPQESTLAEAIGLATEVHAGPPDPIGLGWVHQGGGHWHNGGTGGFHSFAAFHRGTGTAVALLANSADAATTDAAGFAVLTDLARARR